MDYQELDGQERRIPSGEDVYSTRSVTIAFEHYLYWESPLSRANLPRRACPHYRGKGLAPCSGYVEWRSFRQADQTACDAAADGKRSDRDAYAAFASAYPTVSIGREVRRTDPAGRNQRLHRAGPARADLSRPRYTDHEPAQPGTRYSRADSVL